MYAQLMVERETTNKHSFDYVAINKVPVCFVFS